jgi:hypothetical protein
MNIDPMKIISSYHTSHTKLTLVVGLPDSFFSALELWKIRNRRIYQNMDSNWTSIKHSPRGYPEVWTFTSSSK